MSLRIPLSLALATVLAAPVALLATAAPASAASGTFTNASSIVINDGSNATPYPSPIAVSGLAGPITSVSISISGFTHTFPDDVGIVLVAPNGDALLVMDGAGDNPDVTGVDLTFADSGAAELPNVTGPTTGTWKPTAYYTGDSFPAPGPLTAYGHPGPAGGNNATFASRFNGDAANGTWNLFVRDFSAGDGGSISDGWSITINTAIPTTTPTVTGTTPASPNGSTTPKVKGTSETGSTVSLYANSGCTGTPLGSGPAADFAGAGITATVPANASTAIYAKATKPAQSDSACSTTSVTYVQAAPDTTLTKTPKKRIKTTKNKVTVKFEFTSAMAGATFECSMDGKPFAACTSPARYKVRKGKHHFAVRAVSSGVPDPTPATFDFKVKKKRKN